MNMETGVNVMRGNHSRGQIRTGDPLINSRLPETFQHTPQGFDATSFGCVTPERYPEPARGGDNSANTLGAS